MRELKAREFKMGQMMSVQRSGGAVSRVEMHYSNKTYHINVWLNVAPEAHIPTHYLKVEGTYAFTEAIGKFRVMRRLVDALHDARLLGVVL